MHAKTHVSLNVKDVEKSVAFYEAFFGQPVHKRRPGYANFDLEAPSLKLALNQTSEFETQAGPLNHMGIVLDSVGAVNAVRERLNATELTTEDESDTLCCYARQEKVWAHDPDGNAWEVYVILDDMMDGAFESAPSKETDAQGCCTPRAKGIGKELSMVGSGCC